MWETLERSTYPRKALDFDLTGHSAEKYREDLKAALVFAYVAEDKGIILGVAMGRLVGESGLARLGWIGVHPHHQKKGIGTALLDSVVAYCTAKGCHKITLNTTPTLVPAINLYLKAGFVPEAYLRKEWWKVDFLRMSKWIEH
jgi:GNAT superfamily N-acetyltransferase